VAQEPQKVGGERERIAVVNGPVLNLLGMRETSVYGEIDLTGIEKRLGERARELGVEIEFFQSNHEGAILDYLQAMIGRVSGIVLNPAGLTHTSVALRDALLATSVPFVEVHISNIFSRETFRSKSLTADISSGLITGMGWYGYVLALEGLVQLLERRG